MKRFLKRKWHRIPVGIVAVLMALVLVAGSAFAAFAFLETKIEVEVEEAIVLGLWDTWDNLEPYGSVGDVTITLGGTLEVPVITIATVEGYAGSGFVAGEWIVIPVNIRNAGDGELNLSASVAGDAVGHLMLKSSFEENLGPATTQESGQYMCREYEAIGSFTNLSNWSATIPGLGGKSGSAVVGAQVLFVKIIAPGDVAPGTYTFEVTLERS